MNVRNAFSLSSQVKRLHSPEDRVSLCEKLAPFAGEALERWPDNPLCVEIDGTEYFLAEHPDPSKKGKVHVRL